MKLIDIFFTLFFIAMCFVIFAMFTINFDLFMWAAGIGDFFGIGVIILSVFFNKQLSKKVW